MVEEIAEDAVDNPVEDVVECMTKPHGLSKLNQLVLVCVLHSPIYSPPARVQCVVVGPMRVHLHWESGWS